VMTFLDPGYGSVFAGPRTDAASMTLDSRMRTEWNVGPRACVTWPDAGPWQTGARGPGTRERRPPGAKNRQRRSSLRRMRPKTSRRMRRRKNRRG